MQRIAKRFKIKKIQTTAFRPQSKGSLERSHHVLGEYLATSGIYTEDDRDAMQNRIMFTMEQNAVMEMVAQQFTNVSKTNPSLLNVVNKEVLDKLAESVWDKTWGKFIKFGTISGGVIGIFVIIRFIKLVADVVIYGYTLHTVYGWSMHLVGALWDSITHLLLH